VIGISIKGMKELLGMYIGETESASFWQTVCSDLSQRGIEDVFIACTDGLS
jgi:transposase-like protein